MTSPTEIGSFNTAYILEQIPDDLFLNFKPNINLISHFYNQSLLITSKYESRNSLALLKLGHQYYENKKSIRKAIDLYAQAYLSGEPEVSF